MNRRRVPRLAGTFVRLYFQTRSSGRTLDFSGVESVISLGCRKETGLGRGRTRAKKDKSEVNWRRTRWTARRRNRPRPRPRTTSDPRDRRKGHGEYSCVVLFGRWSAEDLLFLTCSVPWCCLSRSFPLLVGSARRCRYVLYYVLFRTVCWSEPRQRQRKGPSVVSSGSEPRTRDVVNYCFVPSLNCDARDLLPFWALFAPVDWLLTHSRFLLFSLLPSFFSGGPRSGIVPPTSRPSQPRLLPRPPLLLHLLPLLRTLPLQKPTLHLPRRRPALALWRQEAGEKKGRVFEL